jgi:electron transfer flavoprotein alpha subunit
MSEIWILVETRDGEVTRATRELITIAQGLGGSGVCAVALGPEGASAAARLPVDKAIVVVDEALGTYSPDGWASVLAGLADTHGPTAILAAATSRGRDLAPRVAALRGSDLASDVVALEREGDALLATRPIYAGKAMATVRVAGNPAMATVRPNSAPPAEGAGEPPVEAATLPEGYAPRARVVSVERESGERPDVSEADRIVSGGRGMGGPEHFALLEDLADALGAAVGASRAVVDAGWRPHGDQVGQTGKTVSPSLYIACGISGAVQHLAGMKTAKTIVAINKDAEAPIFAVADYGIVGDVFEILPHVTAALRARGTG